MPIMGNLLIAAEIGRAGEPGIWCVDPRCAHIGVQGKLFGNETLSTSILVSAIADHDRKYNA